MSLMKWRNRIIAVCGSKQPGLLMHGAWRRTVPPAARIATAHPLRCGHTAVEAAANVNVRRFATNSTNQNSAPVHPLPSSHAAGESTSPSSSSSALAASESDIGGGGGGKKKKNKKKNKQTETNKQETGEEKEKEEKETKRVKKGKVKEKKRGKKQLNDEDYLEGDERKNVDEKDNKSDVSNHFVRSSKRHGLESLPVSDSLNVLPFPPLTLDWEALDMHSAARELDMATDGQEDPHETIELECRRHRRAMIHEICSTLLPSQSRALSLLIFLAKSMHPSGLSLLELLVPQNPNNRDEEEDGFDEKLEQTLMRSKLVLKYAMSGMPKPERDSLLNDLSDLMLTFTREERATISKMSRTHRREWVHQRRKEFVEGLSRSSEATSKPGTTSSQMKQENDKPTPTFDKFGDSTAALDDAFHSLLDNPKSDSSRSSSTGASWKKSLQSLEERLPPHLSQHNPIPPNGWRVGKNSKLEQIPTTEVMNTNIIHPPSYKPDIPDADISALKAAESHPLVKTLRSMDDTSRDSKFLPPPLLPATSQFNYFRLDDHAVQRIFHRHGEETLIVRSTRIPITALHPLADAIEHKLHALERARIMFEHAKLVKRKVHELAMELDVDLEELDAEGNNPPLTDDAPDGNEIDFEVEHDFKPDEFEVEKENIEEEDAIVMDETDEIDINKEGEIDKDEDDMDEEPSEEEMYGIEDGIDYATEENPTPIESYSSIFDELEYLTHLNASPAELFETRYRLLLERQVDGFLKEVPRVVGGFVKDIYTALNNHFSQLTVEEFESIRHAYPECEAKPYTAFIIHHATTPTLEATANAAASTPVPAPVAAPVSVSGRSSPDPTPQPDPLSAWSGPERTETPEWRSLQPNSEELCIPVTNTPPYTSRPRFVYLPRLVYLNEWRTSYGAHGTFDRFHGTKLAVPSISYSNDHLSKSTREWLTSVGQVKRKDGSAAIDVSEKHKLLLRNLHPEISVVELMAAFKELGFTLVCGTIHRERLMSDLEFLPLHLLEAHSRSTRMSAKDARSKVQQTKARSSVHAFLYFQEKDAVEKLTSDTLRLFGLNIKGYTSYPEPAHETTNLRIRFEPIDDEQSLMNLTPEQHHALLREKFELMSADTRDPHIPDPIPDLIDPEKQEATRRELRANVLNAAFRHLERMIYTILADAQVKLIPFQTVRILNRHDSLLRAGELTIECETHQVADQIARVLNDRRIHDLHSRVRWLPAPKGKDGIQRHQQHNQQPTQQQQIEGKTIEQHITSPTQA